MNSLKKKIVKFLRWSQKYTKTDMLYVGKGGFWLVVGKIALLAISVVIMWAFANLISPEDAEKSQEIFGRYQYIISVAAIFSLATLPGINSALVRSIAQKKEGTLRIAVNARLKWSLLGSAGMLATAGWYFIQQDTILATAFVVAGIFLPARYVYVIFEQFWGGRKQFDIRIKYMVIYAALSAATLITTLYFTDNLILIMLAFSGGHGLFAYVFYKKTLKSVKNNEVDETAIPFGKNLTAMAGIEKIAGNLDKIILMNFLGPVQVAVYSFAQMPIDKIKGTLPIQTLALPKLSEKNIDNKRKKGVMSKFLRLFAITIPAAGMLAIAAPPIYGFMFPQYTESVIYFQTLSIAIALLPFMLLHTALVAETKKRELYITQSAVPVIRIILFLALVPFYGIWGIVWAIIGTEFLRGLLTLYYFQKI